MKQQVLNGLILPLRVESGSIVDGAGRRIIKAEREAGETPLSPVGRDAALHLTCALLNESFYYDKADTILAALGY